MLYYYSTNITSKCQLKQYISNQIMNDKKSDD